MADVIKTTNQLKILAGFADEDDRTLSIDNPKDDLTWSQIEVLENKSANVLIGDKYAAKFSRFKEAYYLNTETKTLDLDNT